MSLPNNGPIAQYNSLTDPNLQGFFSKSTIRRHLLQTGLINKRGSIVPDNVYRYKMAQKDQKKHYRQMLAQAIVQEALDIERYRQSQIRNELESAAKKELVRRVRGQIRVNHDVPALWPGSGLPPIRPSTAPTTDKTLDSGVRSESLSVVDMESENQDDRVFVPRPPESERPFRRLKRRNFKNARRTQSASKAREKTPAKEPSPCRITMYYHGKGVHIPYDKKVFDAKDEIIVRQQHCGGENLIVFRDKLEENSTFTFESKRHRDFPFSLSLYIGNTYDCRISTCCEYRHNLNVRIGGKKGRFSIARVTGAKPCYKCLLDQQLKRMAPVKQVEHDEYKEEFEKEEYGDEITDIEIIPHKDTKLDEKQVDDSKEIPIKAINEKEYDSDFENNNKKEKAKNEEVHVEPIKETPKAVQAPVKEKDSFSSGKASPTYVFKPEKRLEIPVIEKEPEKPKEEKKPVEKPIVVEEKPKVPQATRDSDSEASSRVSEAENFNWNVKFYTKDRDDSKNDFKNAIVKLQIFGDNKKKTKKLKFYDSDGKSFQRGKVSSYDVKTQDIGTPKYVIVKTNGSGDLPDWRLEKVELTDTINNKTYVFPYGNWIEKDEVVTIKLKKDKKKKEIEWILTVTTTNLKNKLFEGTNANVYINLIGENKESERIDLRTLSKSSRLFKPGCADVFNFKCADVGNLKQVRVGHDNTGIAPGWHLSHVKLYRREDSKNYLFKCKRWLAKDEDDGKIERVLDLCETQDTSSDEDNNNNNDDDDATSYDQDTDSAFKNAEPVNEAIKKEAERSSTSSDATPVKKIPHSPQESVAGEASNVEQVKEKTKSKSPEPEEKVAPPKRDEVKWIVTLHTNDRGEYDEGTDSNVFLSLIGENGESPKRWLKLDNNKPLYFGPGSRVTCAVMCDVIGDLKKIRIGHDDSGIANNWFLGKVEVHNTETKDHYVFINNQWISASKGKLEVVLDHPEHHKSDKFAPVGVLMPDSEESNSESNKVGSKYKESYVVSESSNENKKNDVKTNKKQPAPSDDEFDNKSEKLLSDSTSATSSASLFDREGEKKVIKKLEKLEEINKTLEEEEVLNSEESETLKSSEDNYYKKYSNERVKTAKGKGPHDSLVSPQFTRSHNKEGDEIEDEIETNKAIEFEKIRRKAESPAEEISEDNNNEENKKLSHDVTNNDANKTKYITPKINIQPSSDINDDDDGDSLIESFNDKKNLKKKQEKEGEEDKINNNDLDKWYNNSDFNVF